MVFYYQKFINLNSNLAIKEMINILLKGENYNEFIYFLPYTLWIESLMNPTLTKSSRLFLIKTAFYILYYFYYQTNHLTVGVSFYAMKDAECQFLNQTFVMHAMNTLIITYCLTVYNFLPSGSKIESFR